MLKLLQSLFGARQAAGVAWPDDLIEAVIERAVDGTDPRLRALRDYRRRLREPALATIAHVMRLVDESPPPVAANQAAYRADFGLRAMFASLERLHEVLGKDANLDAAMRAHPDSDRFTGLLLTTMTEKHVLGFDLENDQLRRDVQQTVLSFDEHRVVDPYPGEDDCRRALKRRAFDHLLAQVLADMGERRETRQGLSRQRELLRRKRAALAGAGWSFDAGAPPGSEEAARLDGELADIERELQSLGTDAETLEIHLGMLADALAEPSLRLFPVERTLHIDPHNVVRAPGIEGAQSLTLRELQDGRGTRIVMRLLGVERAILPHTDFFAAARRYL